MLKYRAISVCSQRTPYGEYLKDAELQEAFEAGWEYVICNKLGNWLHYVVKKEVE